MKSLLIWFFYAILPSLTFASEDRLPIRMSYSQDQCLTFFCPREVNGHGQLEVNESVGLPIAQGDSEQFALALRNLMREKGVDFLVGSTVYLAGVDSHDEASKLKSHQEVLNRLGLSEAIRLKVISIPKEELKGLSLKTFRIIWERTLSWFPSIKKDYERPHLDEVVAGLATTAAIEVGNVYYLWRTLPPLDASLTLTAHAAVLAAYTIYSKMLGNWLQRPGTGRIPGFLKQLSLSVPFVINYNIFGNFTPLMEYLRKHSPQEAWQAFPTQLAQFASSQSLTLFLQVSFYYIVINQVITKWMNTQVGVKRSNEARVWAKIVQSPILMLDAVAVSMAAGAGATTLLSLGTLDVNSGHAFLALLSGFGYLAYKSSLDQSLNTYLWAKQRTRATIQKCAKWLTLR